MAISDAIGSLNKLSAIALVVPKTTGYKAQNNLLDAAMMFHIEAENSMTLTSDITDHIVEDNSTMQDHIGLKPELVTVRGYIGELNTVKSLPLEIASTVVEKLQLVSEFMPELTLAAMRAYNEAEQAYRVAENLVNQFKAQFGDNVYQNRQQTFAQKFYDYWLSKTLFTIQTPWRKYDNMAIQTFRAVQEEDKLFESTFEITFKRVRFANVKFTGPESAGGLQGSLSGRSYYQSSPTVYTGLK